MDRHLIAYALIMLLLIGATVAIVYLLHHSRERTYRRRMSREREARAQRARERDARP